MPVLPSGTKITAEQFNELVSLYDEYWRGDSYTFDSEHTTDLERRKGWGQIQVVPQVNTATEIESIHFNKLGAQVNAGLYHINDSFPLISKRKPNLDYPTSKDVILNSHYNEIYENITVSIDNNKFDTSFQTPAVDVIVSNEALPWSTSISCEVKASFSSYDAARHFFNSGGKLTLDLESIGSQLDWKTVFDSFGQIEVGAVFTNTSTSNSGMQFGGFYSIPSSGEEKLLILLYGQSNGGEYGAYGAYGAYGGYGGGMYSSRNVRVFIRGEQGTSTFDVYLRVQLNEDEDDDVINITSEIILNAGSETPDTIPSQAAFVVDGQEYLFIIREQPVLTVSSDWA